MRPVHPGEILKAELEELEMSANRLAQALAVPANRVSAILAGKRGITADTALRLALFFGTAAEFWMNLQTNHDLALARQKKLPKIERVSA